MAVPVNRDDFKWFCLRQLGHPVINIELDDQQMDDRIDQTLKFYYDHHFDGSEAMYYKWQVQANDFPDVIKDTIIANGGVSYSNSDTVSFINYNNPNTYFWGYGNVVTDSNGSIVSIVIANTGSDYQLWPTVNVITSSGSGANILAERGGYIKVPDNVIGVVDIFDIQSALSAGSFFSIQYQIALNDLYSFFTQSLVPYYTTRMQLNLMEELLIGKQPIRYNRHKGKMYLDWDWNKINLGNYLVLRCYEIVDPNIYPSVWSDYWLQRYTVQQFKQQWGYNLKKYPQGMTLPGGVTISGQVMYLEATAEILRLEQEMINTYSPILAYMTG